MESVRRSWKLRVYLFHQPRIQCASLVKFIKCIICFFAEEFVAHKANVNCLAMGHKSNQVLATGGDDKKVNLWAIGRQSCLMVCIYNIQQFTLWESLCAYNFVKLTHIAELKWTHNSCRMCMLWSFRRSSLCWFTNWCLENLGFGGSKTVENIYWTQRCHQMYGFPSLRRLLNYRLLRQQYKTMGHQKKRLHCDLLQPPSGCQQPAIQSRWTMDCFCL